MTIAEKHIRECAEEAGEEIDLYYSKPAKETYSGIEIQSWYNEDASSSLSAWQAFAKGYGTFSRESREEAIVEVKRRIDECLSR